ncbi:HD domain-containing protein [Candidatus Parcubacteria bacterium]|nr:HD domain-containing protein [Candidatus Parcubacteria bacterium]MBT7228147.1 HD domain-containing protein [Candidatus Parcubacteria bacterium]
MVFLALISVNHVLVKVHCERVALLAENAARVLDLDVKAAFFAGLLHDIGKLTLPSGLFDDGEIDAEEYQQIKTHAIAAYEILDDFHLFIALCAGLHHAVYEHGYGLTTEELPKNWPVELKNKVIRIATLVSICDFVDAASHRKSRFIEASSLKVRKEDSSLRDKLIEQYPNKETTIDAVLEANQEFVA